ncbi:MAG: hypothetical protein ACREIA_20785 [Opitutaceae bacterium]
MNAQGTIEATDILVMGVLGFGLLALWSLVRALAGSKERGQPHACEELLDCLREPRPQLEFKTTLEVDDVTHAISLRGVDPDGRPFCFTGRDLQTVKRAVQAEMSIRYNIAAQDVDLRL